VRTLDRGEEIIPGEVERDRLDGSLGELGVDESIAKPSPARGSRAVELSPEDGVVDAGEELLDVDPKHEPPASHQPDGPSQTPVRPPAHPARIGLRGHPALDRG